jgi:hypothetical protein
MYLPLRAPEAVQNTLSDWSNQVFDILAEWNDYLQRHCSDIYSGLSEPES